MLHQPRHRVVAIVANLQIIDAHLPNPRVEVRYVAYRVVALRQDMEALILAWYQDDFERTNQPPGSVEVGGEINQD